MVERPLSLREYLLVPIALVIGTMLLYDAPFIGLPLSAAVFGRIVLSGSGTLAIVTAVLAVAASALLGVARPLMTAPTLFALVWAARSIDKRETRQVFAVLTTVVFVSFVAAFSVGAVLQDSTLPAAIGVEVDVVMDQFDAVFGGAGIDAATASAYEDARETVHAVLVGVWPGVNLVASMLAVGLSLMLLSRLAIAHGILPKGPRPLVALDLSIHVVWPLIAGLGIAAWAFWMDAETTVLAAVGFNLLIVAAGIVAAQGLGVMEFTMRRFRMGIILRVLAYGFLFWLGGLVPLLAALGAADLWVNFRKLPRGEEPPETDAEDAPGAGVE